jgi:photosystem II stability/assembly factor-like uncharacterized protein
MIHTTRLLLAIAVIIISTQITLAQYSPASFSAMQWRLVGPHRAGRVTAVAGIPGDAATYYFGTPGGGVWKSINGGRVWTPIFDEAHVASIGALALAPSNPDIIYVGTGEETVGNGMYRSDDAGKTWRHTGLEDTRYITGIIVDPKDPNIVLVSARNYFVASQGRGIFKTTDGGKTWKQVYYKDDKTSVVALEVAPDDSRTIYAATYKLQLDFVNRRALGQESLVFKSIDEGDTWQQVTGTGLPAEPRGTSAWRSRPGRRASRHRREQRLLPFRRWQRNLATLHEHPRITGSTFFGKLASIPPILISFTAVQTSMYRSLDGGKTWESYKGALAARVRTCFGSIRKTRSGFSSAPIRAQSSVSTPAAPGRLVPQPTGQFYHVITDNQFPYRLYAAQQDSGSVAVASRSDFGRITWREWFSTGAFESGASLPIRRIEPHLFSRLVWFSVPAWIEPLDRSPPYSGRARDTAIHEKPLWCARRKIPRHVSRHAVRHAQPITARTGGRSVRYNHEEHFRERDRRDSNNRALCATTE